MKARITIDPITRISGFLEIDVEIDQNKIVDARSSGLLFRGFEKMLKGKEPLDAIYFTERICGICSTAHSYASTVALEDAININSSEEAHIIRDIIHGTEFLQNHIRHFYLFIVPDYVKLPEISDLYQSNNVDFRLPDNLSGKIQKNYIASLQYGRMSHEALAVLGGKAPHNHGIFVGGMNGRVNASQLIKLKALLQDIKQFVINNMIEDANIIADYYKDYFTKGASYGNFMSYGLYNSTGEKSLTFVQSGVLIDKKLNTFDSSKINENIYSSWYEGKPIQNIPGEKTIDENSSKEKAYSWIKAPRYEGYPMEVGPLARMIIGEKYNKGIAAMDRVLARVLETKIVIEIMEEKIVTLEELLRSKVLSNAVNFDIPISAKGKGLIDTVRGSLGHWINIQDKKILNYDIITPSGWNLSPQDGKGVKGVLEKALIGTTIQDTKNPVEIGRIVRTFDPCVSCATHVISNNFSPIEIRIL
ncbi:MAG: nickel-dependent hydrogenase large subunit [Clostridiaceae bacterium]|nr:nickel-dependent hydrogenase large subunit [Clostridiaceae bacterium]